MKIFLMASLLFGSIATFANDYVECFDINMTGIYKSTSNSLDIISINQPDCQNIKINGLGGSSELELNIDGSKGLVVEELDAWDGEKGLLNTAWDGKQIKILKTDFAFGIQRTLHLSLDDNSNLILIFNKGALSNETRQTFKRL